MKQKNTDFQPFIHFSCIIQDNRLISYCCEIVKKNIPLRLGCNFYTKISLQGSGIKPSKFSQCLSNNQKSIDNWRGCSRCSRHPANISSGKHSGPTLKSRDVHFGWDKDVVPVVLAFPYTLLNSIFCRPVSSKPWPSHCRHSRSIPISRETCNRQAPANRACQKSF